MPKSITRQGTLNLVIILIKLQILNSTKDMLLQSATIAFTYISTTTIVDLIINKSKLYYLCLLSISTICYNK